MGETSDKLNAAGNKIVGSIKDGVGEMTGNKRLEAEGEMQKAKGHAQDAKADAKGALKDTVDKL